MSDNPFEKLFQSLADPAKLKEFAAQPGEDLPKPTSKEEFKSKEMKKLLLECITTFRDMEVPEGDPREALADILGKLFHMPREDAFELFGIGLSFGMVRDATLRGALHARGAELMTNALDAEVERRWERLRANA